MANSTSPVPQVVEGVGAVGKINELFDAASQAMIGGRNAATSALLTWGYIGGRFNSITTSNGTISLSASTTNYVVWKKSDGVVSVSTATTNWNNSTDYWRLFSVVTNSSTVTSYTDERSSSQGLFGVGGGGGGGSGTVVSVVAGTGISVDNTDPANPVVSATGGGGASFSWSQQTASYTLVLADAETGVAMSVAGSNNLTVPPNSSVAFPVGTTIVVYQEGAGATTVVAGAGVTIRKRAAFTLLLAGQYAMATLVKRATDEWVLSGDLGV